MAALQRLNSVTAGEAYLSTASSIASPVFSISRPTPLIVSQALSMMLAAAARITILIIALGASIRKSHAARMRRAPKGSARRRAQCARRSSLNGAFALQFLADQLARAAHRLRLLASAFFRRLFIKFPALHFAECAFALHLLFQRAKRLLDIIVADNDLNQGKSLLVNGNGLSRAATKDENGGARLAAGPSRLRFQI